MNNTFNIGDRVLSVIDDTIALHEEEGDMPTMELHEARAAIAKLIAQRDELANAIKPFTHPDLTKALGGNAMGDRSPVFQRDNAMLTLGDFRRAAAALANARSAS